MEARLLRRNVDSMPRRTGFTLIELLVVIAIIGLLSSVILASLNTARSKANDAARISDVKSLETALEMYYNDHGTYPQTNGSGCPNISGSGCGYPISALSSFLVPEYIPTIPAILLETNNGYGSSDQYVWGPPSSYGLFIYTETANQSAADYYGFCRTGVNANPGGWWGTPSACNF